MQNLEKFTRSFGFSEDPLLIIIVCVLLLLLNFSGGLFSNIILAFTNITYKLKRIERPSFRLAVVSEAALVIFIVYVHTALDPAIGTAQMIFWGFVVLASPLFAAFGAQLSYVALANRIEELKRRAAQPTAPQMEEENGGEEQGKEAQLSGGETNEHKPKE